MQNQKHLGIILWKGKSLFDGKNIMVVANGMFEKTANRKTGDMIQTYIMRTDIDPMLARRLGEDCSICSDCIHRENSTCYVNLCHGPIPVYKSFHNDRYKMFEESDLELFRDKYIRIGSYGDPAAVPFNVWEKVCSVVAGYTGYTHQFDKCDQRLKSLCMASIDSIDGYLDRYTKAKSLGWRTFRVFGSDKVVDITTKKQESEFICPASKEAGVKTDCQNCKACSGVSSKITKDVLINFHGDSDAMGSNWRLDRYMVVMKKIKNKKKYRRDYAAEREKFLEVCPY
jgi:hypothetical protein